MPIYLITIAAFSPRAALIAFPKSLVPTELSTDTLLFFLSSRGVLSSAWNSVMVGLITLVLSLVIGTPAGYALARYVFRGRDAFQDADPDDARVPDRDPGRAAGGHVHRVGPVRHGLRGGAGAHRAGPAHDGADHRQHLRRRPARPRGGGADAGLHAARRVRRVALPLALPGLAAASIFTFVLSWNEVFAATILTVANRTLPAQVFSSLGDSPLPYRFAGGFALIVPSLVFIFFIRRYLFNMWGRVTR